MENTTNSETVAETLSHAAENHDKETIGSQQDQLVDTVQRNQVEEDASADEFNSQLSQEQGIQDAVPSELTENRQVDAEAAEIDQTFEASDVVEEEAFNAQFINEFATSGADERTYTPEEPAPLEEPHTVEVSGTGGVDPTPQPNEAESIEEPPVPVSTPSGEAVEIAQAVTSLNPPEEEANTIEPTGNTEKAVEDSPRSSPSSSKSAKK